MCPGPTLHYIRPYGIIVSVSTGEFLYILTTAVGGCGEVFFTGYIKYPYNNLEFLDQTPDSASFGIVYLPTYWVKYRTFLPTSAPLLL